MQYFPSSGIRLDSDLAGKIKNTFSSIQYIPKIFSRGKTVSFRILHYQKKGSKLDIRGKSNV